MSRRWITYSRGASLRPHFSFCRGPVGRLIAVLLPMRDRSFVAPIQDFRHDSAMRAGRHESTHRLLVTPEGSCPEDEFHLSAYVGAQAARAAAGLPHACERTQEELGERADGTHPQTRDRCERHWANRQSSPAATNDRCWRFCVSFWHLANITITARNVRFRG